MKFVVILLLIGAAVYFGPWAVLGALVLGAVILSVLAFEDI